MKTFFLLFSNPLQGGRIAAGNARLSGADCPKPAGVPGHRHQARYRQGVPEGGPGQGVACPLRKSTVRLQAVRSRHGNAVLQDVGTVRPRRETRPYIGQRGSQVRCNCEEELLSGR